MLRFVYCCVWILFVPALLPVARANEPVICPPHISQYGCANYVVKNDYEAQTISYENFSDVVVGHVEFDSVSARTDHAHDGFIFNVFNFSIYRILKGSPNFLRFEFRGFDSARRCESSLAPVELASKGE